MSWKVIEGPKLLKQIKKKKIPKHILHRFYAWIELVEMVGLKKAQAYPGFNDEPCLGLLFGFRSIRLSRGWRAYYKIDDNIVKIIFVERIDKHEY